MQGNPEIDKAHKAAARVMALDKPGPFKLEKHWLKSTVQSPKNRLIELVEIRKDIYQKFGDGIGIATPGVVEILSEINDEIQVMKRKIKLPAESIPVPAPANKEKKMPEKPKEYSIPKAQLDFVVLKKMPTDKTTVITASGIKGLANVLRGKKAGEVSDKYSGWLRKNAKKHNINRCPKTGMYWIPVQDQIYFTVKKSGRKKLNIE